MAAAPAGRFSAGFRRTFEALDVPGYRILWWGTLFSFIGMQMQVVARGYLAFDLTRSNTALGGVMIAFGIPQLLLSLYGGTVADRLAKRNVIIFWQSMIALASALMAVAIFADVVAYWMLIASGVATGASFSFIGPARQAFIGDLVPARLMGNAIVLQQANMNGTRVVGPALAGALIAVPLIGMGGVYALTTIGFIFSVVTMFKLPPGRPRQGTTNHSALQATREGISYVRQNRPVAILISMSFLVVALGFPYQGFLASITRDEFDRGAIGLGLLSSMTAVGALAATLSVATLTGHRHVWRMQALAGIAFGLSLVAFGASPSFGTGLLIALCVGATASGFQSLNSALTMTLTEPRYFGRVQALMGLSWSLFGIISLPLGIVADAIGIRSTLMLMGLASIISILVLWFIGRVVNAESEMAERRALARQEVFERTPPPATEEIPRPAAEATGPAGH
ncbi:MAG: MFS transporter [Dehalococcoidia bacterium]